jgi:putative tryptophan/tyrosine transport system substrate-binding protein
MASRRALLALLGAALGLPSALRAADEGRLKPRRVALLSPLPENDREMKLRIEALARGLRELGWIEGQNIRLEARYAAGSDDALRRYCRELGASKPDLLVVVSNQALAILREEKIVSPTLFISVSDPVGSGFVASLSRPGGNMTGFTNYDPATGAKWFEVLKELAPEIARIGLLLNSRIVANLALVAGVESAASAKRVTTVRIDAAEASDIERGFALVAGQRNAGLIVMPNPTNVLHQEVIFELAAKHRLPAIYPFSHMARKGGLVAYGIDQLEQYRAAASYVDRILKGAKPGELPVQQPSSYELVINLRAARNLGLNPSPALLARANEVLQ